MGGGQLRLGRHIYIDPPPMKEHLQGETLQGIKAHFQRVP